ncbi:hypothetical protein BDQ17DRAFT_423024 [Cyathus striatus]|nr:hypothetical protein BDQ17DRAFT_423024 [Cyathus striatus]
MSNQQHNAGPRPIPRGEQAMSFSAAITSPSAYTLTYFLKNTKPEDLHETLLRAVKNNMMLPYQIDHLLYSLQISGIVTTAAYIAATDTTQRHCVRCHKGYLERNNGLSACVIQHDKPSLEKSDHPVNNLTGHLNHYTCCNLHSEPSVTLQPHCFKGRHTTNVDNVEFNAFNVKQCHEMGCFNQHRPPSTLGSTYVGPRPLQPSPSIDMMMMDANLA